MALKQASHVLYTEDDIFLNIVKNQNFFIQKIGRHKYNDLLDKIKSHIKEKNSVKSVI